MTENFDFVNEGSFQNIVERCMVSKAFPGLMAEVSINVSMTKKPRKGHGVGDEVQLALVGDCYDLGDRIVEGVGMEDMWDCDDRWCLTGED